MVVAQTAEPPAMIYAIYTKPRRGSWLQTLEKDNQTHPILEEDATSVVSIADNASEVHYKHTQSKESQITRRHVVQDDVSKFLLEDWRTKVQASENYSQYRNEFLSMLSEFQSM